MESIQVYRQGWQERERQREEQERCRALEARKSLTTLIAILKKYPVKKIIPFGSLAKNNRLHAGSDIDLAVVGLPSDQFFTAYGEIMMTSDFNVDLKPLEDLEPFFKQQILSIGEVIYAATDQAGDTQS